MKIKVVKNFFKKKHLKYLNSLKLFKKAKDNGIVIYHNQISKDGKMHCELFDKKNLKEFNKIYHPIAINILKKLSPKKVDLYEYSEFHFVETGKNFQFPIHDDIPNKLLSGVIYIKPKNNTGTIFYKKKNGYGKKEINWEVNKAIFFSREEKKTWHSYEGDGKSNRFTIVYNLMTNNIRGVFLAENKNSYLGIFRKYINPFLFRYLNITI